MRAVLDTGPLLAAALRRDRAHRLATRLLAGLGRDALVPELVLAEADWYLRKRAGAYAGRALLRSATDGEVTVQYLTPGLLRDAVATDARYADLNLGLVDASVMAIAERERVPILTFDFEDFRAAPRANGEPWTLLVDEATFSRYTAR